jgi:hypothetical protein
MENKQIVSPEVLCFGQLLFEMATGIDRAAEQKIAAFKDRIPPELYTLLELIFESKDPQTAPSLKVLLKHEFFSGAQVEVKIHKSVLVEEWDEKVRASLKQVRHITPKTINPNAQLTLKRTPSVANVDSIARRGSGALSPSSSSNNLSVTSPITSPVTSPRPTSPPPPSRATSPPPQSASSSASSKSKIGSASARGPAPPPPPPPPARTSKLPQRPMCTYRPRFAYNILFTASKSVAVELPPPTEGRNALLDSIRNANPLSRLKKSTPPKK